MKPAIAFATLAVISLAIAAFATLAVISLAIAAFAGEVRESYIAKTAHLGNNAVAITCTNGADPTGNKIADNVLVVSCGK